MIITHLQSDLQIYSAFYQLRVLDSPQQRLAYIFETTVNTLSEENRPQQRDHYPAFFDKCVASFKSPDSVSRDWTYGLTSLTDRLAPYQLG